MCYDNYPRRLCRSAWIGRSRPPVCRQHNSKTNDPKVFKLGIGNDLGTRSDMLLDLKGQRSSYRVSKSILNTRTAIH